MYRFVSERLFRQFSTFAKPEILRCPLELSILRVKKLELGKPKELLGLALSPPDLGDIYEAVLNLKLLSALSVTSNDVYDPEDGDLTVIGDIMSQLPIDVRLSKLIIMGHLFGLLDECVTIAACLSNKGMFMRPFGRRVDAYKSRLAWSDRSFSDLVAYINAYKTYKSQ